MTMNHKPTPPMSDPWMNLPGCVYDDERVWLRDVASLLPPGAHVLEVGTWLGASMGCIMAGLRNDREGLVYTIDDWNPTKLERLERQLIRARLPKGKVVMLRGKSADWWDTWGTPLHMAFIDGAHDAETVQGDLSAFSRTVLAGGLLAFHDARLPPAPHRQAYGYTVERVRTIKRHCGVIGPILDKWLEICLGRWVEAQGAGSIRAFRRLDWRPGG